MRKIKTDQLRQVFISYLTKYTQNLPWDLYPSPSLYLFCFHDASEKKNIKLYKSNFETLVPSNLTNRYNCTLQFAFDSRGLVLGNFTFLSLDTV